jgi:hypothetical protein
VFGRQCLEFFGGQDPQGSVAGCLNRAPMGLGGQDGHLTKRLSGAEFGKVSAFFRAMQMQLTRFDDE